jgi:hypothetical protein
VIELGVRGKFPHVMEIQKFHNNNLSGSRRDSTSIKLQLFAYIKPLLPYKNSSSRKQKKTLPFLYLHFLHPSTSSFLF